MSLLVELHPVFILSQLIIDSRSSSSSSSSTLSVTDLIPACALTFANDDISRLYSQWCTVVYRQLCTLYTVPLVEPEPGNLSIAVSSWPPTWSSHTTTSDQHIDEILETGEESHGQSQSWSWWSREQRMLEQIVMESGPASGSVTMFLQTRDHWRPGHTPVTPQCYPVMIHPDLHTQYSSSSLSWISSTLLKVNTTSESWSGSTVTTRDERAECNQGSCEPLIWVCLQKLKVVWRHGAQYFFNSYLKANLGLNFSFIHWSSSGEDKN